MSVQPDKPDAFTQAIMEASRQRVRKILDEVTASAVADLQRRLAEVADQMALGVLAYYSVEWQRNQLVITVKKPDEVRS